jgi:hypothetical protein
LQTLGLLPFNQNDRRAAADLAFQQRSSLRSRGFDNCLDVLSELGKLGLRPPVAPMDGPNLEARRRGRALLRQALTDAKP